MTGTTEKAGTSGLRGLFDWPARALKRSASGRGEGRLIAKEQLYRQRRPSAAIKASMVQQVEQIVWQYALTEATTNLTASPDVPEIQVFQVLLREPELSEAALRYLDSIIPFPTLFELRYEKKCCVIACHKRPAAKKGADWVLGEYFSSDWHSVDAPRAALPVALNLSGLYAQLLRALVRLPGRPGETLETMLGRAENARRLNREIQQAESRLIREKQFNRKVEINAHLRSLKMELDELVGGKYS